MDNNLLVVSLRIENMLISFSERERDLLCVSAVRYFFPFFNPFPADVCILYPLKTPENQRFSGVFKGHKM